MKNVDINLLREIVDDLYSDFDWYRGKFSKPSKKRFLKYLKELNEASKGFNDE